MKKFISISLFISACFLGSCSSYDDERIWQDLNEIEKTIGDYEAQAETLTKQMTSLSKVIGSSFITLISQDADGNHLISYSDGGGETHTVTIATQEDAIKLPIITAKQDTDSKFYWAQTTDKGKTYTFILDGDGKKFPIGGTMPDVKINENGYWSVNGASTGVLANDLSNLLFKSAYIDDKTGEAVFILADGQELRMSLQEALGIRFNSPVYNAVTDYATPVSIPYEIYGTQSENAYVDLFTAYNMEVKIDKASSTLIATMKEGATEGNILLLASAGNNTVLKPIYFTYGTAILDDPLYQGHVGPIQLKGTQMDIEMQISANIFYQVSTENEWITYKGTRALITTTHAFTILANETGDERSGKIIFSNSLYNISSSIDVIQEAKEVEAKGGISTAADLVNFAKAVNNGTSTSRWQNDAGEIVLLNDIDMSSVTSWTPIGDIEASNYTTAEPYVSIHPFTGTFNGQGHAIKNLNCSADITNGGLAYGLFGSIENATIKNLVLGDASTTITWMMSGTASKYTVIAPLVCFAKKSVIEGCTNYYNIDFTADNKSGEFNALSGLVGTIVNTTIGGESKAQGCSNRGFVRTGRISNTANGGTGMQTAGICAFMAKAEGGKLNYCTNYGDISCPSGRTGGIVATLMYGNIYNCDNRGTIEDDKVGQHEGKEASVTYNYKRMGGIVGGTDDLKTKPEYTVESCTNYGNVMTHLSVRTGGIIGHSNIQIIGCVNKGAVLGDVFTEGNGTNRHGPGWLCGYSGASTATWTNCKACVCGGYVGDYSKYKDDPTSAPDATNQNAFCHANQNFDPSINF